MLGTILFVISSFVYAIGWGVLLGLGAIFVEKVAEQKDFPFDKN